MGHPYCGQNCHCSRISQAHSKLRKLLLHSFTDAMAGKLDQTECATLVSKLKEYVDTELV